MAWCRPFSESTKNDSLEIYTLFVLPGLIVAMASVGYMWIARHAGKQPHGRETSS